MTGSGEFVAFPVAAIGAVLPSERSPASTRSGVTALGGLGDGAVRVALDGSGVQADQQATDGTNRPIRIALSGRHTGHAEVFANSPDRSVAAGASVDDDLP